MGWDLILEEKLNQSYQGKAEFCYWTFTVNLPDQVGASWTAKESLNAHIEELQNQGAVVLEYRLWENKEPTWTTDYYVQVVSTASPIIWAAVVIGVIALLALVVTYFIIHETGVIIEYIGEKAAITLPLIAIGFISLCGVVALYLIKRGKKPKEAT